LGFFFSSRFKFIQTNDKDYYKFSTKKFASYNLKKRPGNHIRGTSLRPQFWRVPHAASVETKKPLTTMVIKINPLIVFAKRSLLCFNPEIKVALKINDS
jgi:hypothetical protein